jgi:hypothetical protein
MPTAFDFVAGILGFIFTLLIFSYLIGDNPLFRVAVYIFIGVSAGYIAAVAWWQVIIPRLIYPLVSALGSGDVRNAAMLVAPALGALFLVLFPRQTGLGKVVMAYLVGVGAAVTIAGALVGTLLPQFLGAVNLFDMSSVIVQPIKDWVEPMLTAGVTLIGTILTLVYFHFGARRKADGSVRRLGLVEFLAWGGRIIIGITLGAVYAGVYAAALTALIERLSSLINFIVTIIIPLIRNFFQL